MHTPFDHLSDEEFLVLLERQQPRTDIIASAIVRLTHAIYVAGTQHESTICPDCGGEMQLCCGCE